MQRRDFKAGRNIGLSATVSALALNVAGSSLSGFFHHSGPGTRGLSMTAPANATIRTLWTRIWRIRLARYAMKGANALTALAEWLLPEDLKRWR